MSTPVLAVVIPARNAAATLRRCLGAVNRTAPVPHEIIVVDDGSSDGTGDVARECGATVVRQLRTIGPARARNAGVAVSTAAIIVFIDADVEVGDDALRRVTAAFADDPTLSALFGSYDASPEGGTLVSDYRNLLHHYVHQHANPAAGTFWAGLGAARRDVFLEHGGFDERYARPSIEDIELGVRLAAAGCRIRLDKDLQGKHLKDWTFSSMVRTDVLDRARPWADLILRRGHVPADLNLRWRDRVSATCVWAAVALAASAIVLPVGGLLAAAALSPVAVLNRDFYRFLAARRGLTFTAGAFGLHAMYYAYASGTFAWCFLEHAVRRMRSRAPSGTSDGRRPA